MFKIQKNKEPNCIKNLLPCQIDCSRNAKQRRKRKRFWDIFFFSFISLIFTIDLLSQTGDVIFQVKRQLNALSSVNGLVSVLNRLSKWMMKQECASEQGDGNALIRVQQCIGNWIQVKTKCKHPACCFVFAFHVIPFQFHACRINVLVETGKTKCCVNSLQLLSHTHAHRHHRTDLWINEKWKPQTHTRIKIGRNGVTCYSCTLVQHTFIIVIIIISFSLIYHHNFLMSLLRTHTDTHMQAKDKQRVISKNSSNSSNGIHCDIAYI